MKPIPTPEIDKPTPILGIDFGTTTSTACLFDGSVPVFIAPKGDHLDGLMPSVVCFPNRDTTLVGERALNALNAVSPLNVVQHIKRMIVYDAHWSQMPASLRQKYTFFEKCYRPAEIAGKIIQALKIAAEERLREDDDLRSKFDYSQGRITTAVITVPAQFGRFERQSIEDAAKQFGGFLNVKLLEEPVAAALSLDFLKRQKQSHGIAVKPQRLTMIVDLGGGTLDVCLMWMGENVPQGGFYEVGRIGDNELGGTDWDRTIANGVMQETSRKYSIPPALLVRASDISRNYYLHRECERAKIDLCEERKNPLEKVDVGYPDPYLNLSESINHTVTREWFLENTRSLSEWCATRCETLLSYPSLEDLAPLKKSKLSWDDVDEIVLVGGGSQVPAVREILSAKAGQDADGNEKVSMADSPQHQVVMGAALYARQLAERKTLSGIGRTRSPMTLGVVKKSRVNGRNGHAGSVPHSTWNGHDTTVRDVFATIIEPSQPAGRTTEVEFTLVPPDATSFLARIVEKRVSRLFPNGRYFHVMDLKIPELPDPKTRRENKVIITMVYGDDHKLSAEADCCGEKCAVGISENDIRQKGTPIELYEPPHDGKNGSAIPNQSIVARWLRYILRGFRS